MSSEKINIKIPGQQEMIDGFTSRFQNPLKGKVNKQRARRLKQNQTGSLCMKIRHACPRCQKGTLKKHGRGEAGEMICNNDKCGFSKPWGRLGYNV